MGSSAEVWHTFAAVINSAWKERTNVAGLLLSLSFYAVHCRTFARVIRTTVAARCWGAYSVWAYLYHPALFGMGTTLAMRSIKNMLSAIRSTEQTAPDVKAIFAPVSTMYTITVIVLLQCAVLGHRVPLYTGPTLLRFTRYYFAGMWLLILLIITRYVYLQPNLHITDSAHLTKIYPCSIVFTIVWNILYVDALGTPYRALPSAVVDDMAIRLHPQIVETLSHACLVQLAVGVPFVIFRVLDSEVQYVLVQLLGQMICVFEHLFAFQVAYAQFYSQRIDSRVGTISSSDAWVDRYVQRGGDVRRPWTRL